MNNETEIALWPEAASTTAHQVDVLFFAVVGICSAVGLLVAFLLIYFCFRYRRREGETEPPPETHESKPLEWFWTLAPLAFFFGFFWWGGVVYFDAYRPPDDATVIYGIGKQWMWKFQHPEGQREINALHVPVGRPIQVLLTSEDVIHSFFVPAFRAHMDVLPDRYTSLWFEATKPGTYHLFCSQYCGTSHSKMIGEVTVMWPADYEVWLRQRATGSLALEGRKLFLKYRCISCHSADANARAPVLEAVFDNPVRLQDGRVVIADENYIRQSILHPSAKIVAGYQNIMPSFQGQVDAEEINALIAFIRGLEPEGTPERVESYPPPKTTPLID